MLILHIGPKPEGQEKLLSWNQRKLGLQHPKPSNEWHSLTVLPDGADELVLRLPQLLHNVLVQRVHVLHQPLPGGVVDAAGVVQHGEVGLAAEVRLGELQAGYRHYQTC